MAKTNLTSVGRFRASLSRVGRDREISLLDSHSLSHSHSQTPICQSHETQSDSEGFDDDDVKESDDDIRNDNEDERVEEGDEYHLRVVERALNDASGATHVVVTNACLLDCPICHDPLSKRIYQVIECFLMHGLL